MRPVVLFSGGLDSLFTFLWLRHQGQDPLALFCFLQTAAMHNDLSASHLLMGKLNCSLLKDYRLQYFGPLTKDSDYIEARNLLLAITALSYGSEVYLGGLRDDNVADKTPAAFEKMTECLRLITGRPDVAVLSALWQFSKVEMVAEWIRLGFPGPLLKVSRSCYGYPVVSCGACPSCFRKWVALEANGIDTSGWWNKPVQDSALAREYTTKILDPKYDAVRRVSTLQVLKRFQLCA